MLKDRKAYEARLDEQLAGWGADIEVFKIKAKGVSVDGMMKFDQTVAALKQKHQEAGVQLRNLKEVGDEAWVQVMAATEKAWEEFKVAFQNIF
jgi:hypothetical protein